MGKEKSIKKLIKVLRRQHSKVLDQSLFKEVIDKNFNETNVMTRKGRIEQKILTLTNTK